MLFNSWAGVLAPEQFRRYVIDPTRRIVAALRARFPDVPVIGFPRMAGLVGRAYARETGVNAVGLDTADGSGRRVRCCRKRSRRRAISTRWRWSRAARR